MKQRPNILFIVLDTVRAKSLSLYGGELSVDNGISQIADNGIIYDNSLAPSAWTLPSHVSMFTGELPSEHGVINPDSLFDPSSSLPLKLSDDGYQTFGVSANPFIGPRNGFDQAFDKFHHVVPTPTTQVFTKGRDALKITRDINKTGLDKISAIGSQTFRESAPIRTVGNLIWYKLSMLSTLRHRDQRQLSGGPKVTKDLTSFIHKGESPFFAFANFMEAHGPYCAPKRYIENHLSNSDVDMNEFELDPWTHMIGNDVHSELEIETAQSFYNAAIDYLDDQIGELLSALKAAGIREETIVVVTSDHGEAFGERGRLDHNCLYQPVTRVPLMIDHPNKKPAEIARPVNIRYLYSTLLREAEVENCGDKSLFRFRELPETVISQYLALHIQNLEQRFDQSLLEPFKERLQSCFTPEYQLLIGDKGTEELIPFDGSVEPIDGNSEIRIRLRDQLPSFPDPQMEAISSAGPDEELLRSLGYLE